MMVTGDPRNMSMVAGGVNRNSAFQRCQRRVVDESTISRAGMSTAQSATYA